MFTLLMHKAALTKIPPRTTISYVRYGRRINRYAVKCRSPFPGNHCRRMYQNGNGLGGETVEYMSSSLKAMKV